MLSFFEIAVVFLTMMMCINGMFFVFGGPVANLDFEYAAENEMLISQSEVQSAAITSENSVKEGDAFAAIFSFPLLKIQIENPSFFAIKGIISIIAIAIIIIQTWIIE